VVRASGSAHLVGSVPLEDAETVFRSAASTLGTHLCRIPDGETGKRSAWIAWQGESFAQNAAFEDAPPPIDNIPFARSFQLRSDVDPNAVGFGDIGFAENALESYATFARLQAARTIPATTRFLVSLATPPAIISRFVARRDQAAIEPIYERAMMNELGRIVAGVPHDRLAIQWDVAYEIAMWERAAGHPDLQHPGGDPWFPDVQNGIVERLSRYGDAIPADVELGFHFCYGDRRTNDGERGKHFAQPLDTGVVVDVITNLTAALKHGIAWVHLPVPIDRDDEAYFAPLARLRLPATTQLYLGLLHDQDGVEGAERRMTAAKAAIAGFGIATECGFGRRPPESIPELLDLHRQICDRIATVSGPPFKMSSTK
jgi:hypothetical protein